MGGFMDWGWNAEAEISAGSLFTDDQLAAMREAYEIDDGSVGPDDHLVEA